MSYHLYLSIYLYLWIAPHVLLFGLAMLMYHRGLHRSYPIFFTYVVFEFVEFVVLASTHWLHGSNQTYLTIDTISRLASIVLRFAIIQELLEASVAGDVSLRRKLSRTLNGVAVLLIVLAAGFIGSLYYTILAQRASESQVIIQALNMAQCGLLVLVFLWHGFLGLQIAPFAFGIAIGMGLVTGSEPLRKALTDSLSIHYSGYLNIAQMGIYHLSVLIWLYYAWVRQEVVSRVGAPLPQLQEQAAEIGRILER